jgi:hypothetical protein
MFEFPQGEEFAATVRNDKIAPKANALVLQMSRLQNCTASVSNSEGEKAAGAQAHLDEPF